MKGSPERGLRRAILEMAASVTHGGRNEGFPGEGIETCGWRYSPRRFEAGGMKGSPERGLRREVVDHRAGLEDEGRNEGFPGEGIETAWPPRGRSPAA